MKTVLAKPAPKLRSNTVRNVAWIYAGTLTVMVVAQLFAFEEFRPLIESYGLPGGQGTGWFLASLIVVCEVFALPFLLRMDLSPLMRWFSLFCGGFTAFLWLLLSLYATGQQLVIDSGLLGTKVVIHTGVTAIAASLILAIFAAWSIWGLWPAYKKR
jgi:hypothetical protein